ncbi:MAG: hypothetical protein AAF050_17035 [Cyanobacteria bacterium J06649_5]
MTKKVATKGFGKAQPKKGTAGFSQFWVVEGEVWATNTKSGGAIKPCKETNRYQSGDTKTMMAGKQKEKTAMQIK